MKNKETTTSNLKFKIEGIDGTIYYAERVELKNGTVITAVVNSDTQQNSVQNEIVGRGNISLLPEYLQNNSHIQLGKLATLCNCTKTTIRRYVNGDGGRKRLEIELLLINNKHVVSSKDAEVALEFFNNQN